MVSDEEGWVESVIEYVTLPYLVFIELSRCDIYSYILCALIIIIKVIWWKEVGVYKVSHVMIAMIFQTFVWNISIQMYFWNKKKWKISLHGARNCNKVFEKFCWN